MAENRLMARLRRQVCVRCERPVEHYEQVGRCVYADPCGHRQYQGKLLDKLSDNSHA